MTRKQLAAREDRVMREEGLTREAARAKLEAEWRLTQEGVHDLLEEGGWMDGQQESLRQAGWQEEEIPDLMMSGHLLFSQNGIPITRYP
jgi:hypothetical protein